MLVERTGGLWESCKNGDPILCWVAKNWLIYVQLSLVVVANLERFLMKFAGLLVGTFGLY
jgi:hypothetical protein